MQVVVGREGSVAGYVGAGGVGRLGIRVVGEGRKAHKGMGQGLARQGTVQARAEARGKNIKVSVVEERSHKRGTRGGSVR